MNKKLIVKIIIDIGMTVCLLLLMPYSLLSETIHEWLGIAMFVLFVIHHILNRKWMAAIFKGRYTPFRRVQTGLVLLMLGLMLGSMVSGILLSNYIFKMVRIVAISMQAAKVHMFCAYWGLVVMSLHLGMHWNMVVTMTGRLFEHPSAVRAWVARAIACALAGYGIYACKKRWIVKYLFMKVHFVFYDYSEKVVFYILDYIAVMVLFAFVAYYGGKLLWKIPVKQK